MAVKIKLQRLGKIRQPYYRIVVADARTRRDGKAIETIGKYHPKEDPSFIEVDSERAQYWLTVGAQPTEPVAAIFKVSGDWQKFKGEAAPPPMKVAAPKPDKKALYEEAVRASGGEEPAEGATTAKKKAAPKKAAADAPAEAPADAAADAPDADDKPAKKATKKAAAEAPADAAAEAPADAPADAPAETPAE